MTEASLPLPCFDTLQSLGHCSVRAALEVRITFQPSSECLFRTEEVIDSSATADEHNGAHWLCLDDLSLVENHSNSAGAVRR